MKIIITIFLISLSTQLFSQNENKVDSCKIKVTQTLQFSCPPVHQTWINYTCIPDTFNFKVFNRWGNLVFETDNIQSYWEGEQTVFNDTTKVTSNQNLPQGTYYYILVYVILPEENKVSTGYLQIKR